MKSRATSAAPPVSCSLTEIAHLPPQPPNLPCVMPQPVTFTGSKRWARLRRNCFEIDNLINIFQRINLCLPCISHHGGTNPKYLK